MAKRSAAMQALFKSETAAMLKNRQQNLLEVTKRLAQTKAELLNAKKSVKAAKAMHTCSHPSWRDAGGGSVIGDRFVDVCTRCGYENHV